MLILFIFIGFTAYKPKDYGIDLKRIKRDILDSILLLIFIIFISNIIIRVISWFYMPIIGDYVVLKKKISSFSLFLHLLSVFVTPISEEVIFRGYIINKLKNLGFLSVIISTLFFTGFHLGYNSITQIIVVSFVGLSFGYYYYKIGRLTPLILTHAIYNSLSMLRG